MTKPSDFIQNSDYTSIGSDAVATATLVLPNSATITAGSQGEWHTDITVGKINAPMLALMSSTKGGSASMPVTSLIVKADHYSYPSTGDLGELWTAAYLYRLNATTVRLQCIIDNSNGPSEAMSVSGFSQTVTAQIRTFVDPLLT
jgi:hypothetical protein